MNVFKNDDAETKVTSRLEHEYIQAATVGICSALAPLVAAKQLAAGEMVAVILHIGQTTYKAAVEGKYTPPPPPVIQRAS